MLFKVDPYLQIILIKLVKSELTYDLKLQRLGGCTQKSQFNTTTITKTDFVSCFFVLGRVIGHLCNVLL